MLLLTGIFQTVAALVLCFICRVYTMALIAIMASSTVLMAFEWDVQGYILYHCIYNLVFSFSVKEV